MEQLQNLVRGRSAPLHDCRGLGRSYGDAAQRTDGTVIELPATDRIELAPASGRVRAAAGVGLDQILRVSMPAGFCLPLRPAAAI
jgi:decaprenylphospho-beta-D-ribofuranose 2-oxidase